MPEIQDVRRFQETGYVIASGLFNQEEVQSYREHFMQMRAAGTYPGDFAGVDLTSSDPLKRYPRMIHMHRWDDISLGWMLDERLNDWMTDLLGVEPYAVQTMLYFKPAGGRGQALHQDQYYLKVQPGDVHRGVDGAGRLRHRKRLSASGSRHTKSAHSVYCAGRHHPEFH